MLTDLAVKIASVFLKDKQKRSFLATLLVVEAFCDDPAASVTPVLRR